MTDETPERIWTCSHLGEYGNYYPECVEAEGEHGGYGVEYVRADLLAAKDAEIERLKGWLDAAGAHIADTASAGDVRRDPNEDVLAWLDSADNATRDQAVGLCKWAADEIRALRARDVRRRALEEAAVEAEKDHTPAYGPSDADMEYLAETQRRQIAERIRALIATPPQPAPTVQEAAPTVEAARELGAALRELSDNWTRAPYLSEWKHIKSGGEYAVKMHVLLEATLEPAVVYYRRYADPLETWCRPAAEFFDGRFRALSQQEEGGENG